MSRESRLKATAGTPLAGTEPVADPIPPPTAEPVGDAELIEASGQESEWFTEIFDRYYSEIHRYVDRRLGADAADDIAAETFLVAFRKRTRFDAGQGTARSWLYGIATRLVSRHRRNEARRYRAMSRLGDGEVPAEGHEDRVALRSRPPVCAVRPTSSRGGAHGTT